MPDESTYIKIIWVFMAMMFSFIILLAYIVRIHHKHYLLHRFQRLLIPFILIFSVGLGQAQNITILDEKPVVLPRVSDPGGLPGVESVGSHQDPYVFGEEYLLRLGYAVFLEDGGLNISTINNSTSLFYA
jgi:hypothetical protein